MEDGFLEIKALGRPCYLGQLYDARTSSLIPAFSLFKEKDITAREGKVTKTNLKFTEVKSLSDRASSLNVSAELSVSIMSGAIGVSGGGSYLNGKVDTSESITVAAIAQYRTTSRSLDFNTLLSKMDMDTMKLAKTRATHVVTSIVYGGDVIGTLTQKSTNKEDNTEIKGKFSIEVFKVMGKWFSAEAKSELSVNEREKINNFNLDLDLSADFSLKDEDAAPTDPMSLIAVVKKSAKLVGDGVPCELWLTPLTMLTEDVPIYRELARADLVDIMNIYDRILKLENSRAWLRDAVEVHAELFPTFTAVARDGSIKVTKLVQNARDRLCMYLQRYRSGQKDVEEPSNFVTDVAEGFAAAQAEYEREKDEWRGYLDRLSVAERHGFPVVGVGVIGSKMICTDKGMLAVILVPENANWKTLMDLYGDLAVDIRQWRASIDGGTDDKTSKGSQTEFISIYADPLRDATLKLLDDKTGTLKNALASARYIRTSINVLFTDFLPRQTNSGIFLTYGRAQGHVGGLEWNMLNKEGWGVIINRDEAWRYIGYVHLSKPHGSGVMTYVNQTKYAGTFVNGQRDGFGEIINKDGTVVSNMRGIFIKNVFAPHGVLVDVTVVKKDGIPIQYGKVALNRFDSVRVHVDRIGTIMGWELNQRFRLIPEGGTKVDVIGTMIDPKEPSNLQMSSWNLNVTSTVIAHIL
jgi:hypothetical protein